MTEIGFLGLGSMGSALAGRLLESGQRLRVWNRSSEPVARLVEKGASAARDAADALSCRVSISMLADDAAAEAVLTPESVAAAEGGVHVNMATLGTAEADRLAERFAAAGARYVAAPVLGRPNLAATGGLNILAAGSADAIDEVASLLDVLGVRTWRMGESPRTANAVKIAVNYSLLHAVASLGESIALAERHGADPEEFVELMTNSLFGGIAYSVYGGAMARREYEPPGFTVALGLKDLALAEQAAAEERLELPTAHAVREVFERALALPELEGLDWASVAEVSRGSQT